MLIFGRSELFSCKNTSIYPFRLVVTIDILQSDMHLYPYKIMPMTSSVFPKNSAELHFRNEQYIQKKPLDTGSVSHMILHCKQS